MAHIPFLGGTYYQSGRRSSPDPHNDLNPQMDHYIGIDVGTGSARACIIDQTGDIKGLAANNIGLWTPQQGYYVGISLLSNNNAHLQFSWRGNLEEYDRLRGCIIISGVFFSVLIPGFFSRTLADKRIWGFLLLHGLVLRNNRPTTFGDAFVSQSNKC